MCTKELLLIENLEGLFLFIDIYKTTLWTILPSTLYSPYVPYKLNNYKKSQYCQTIYQNVAKQTVSF